MNFRIFMLFAFLTFFASRAVACDIYSNDDAKRFKCRCDSHAFKRAIEEINLEQYFDLNLIQEAYDIGSEIHISANDPRVLSGTWVPFDPEPIFINHVNASRAWVYAYSDAIKKYEAAVGFSDRDLPKLKSMFYQLEHSGFQSVCIDILPHWTYKYYTSGGRGLAKFPPSLEKHFADRQKLISEVGEIWFSVYKIIVEKSEEEIERNIKGIHSMDEYYEFKNSLSTYAPGHILYFDAVYYHPRLGPLLENRRIQVSNRPIK